MTGIEELKSEARRAEARGEWERAARLYLRAVSAAETDEVLPDPGLLVRVGDLENRLGDRDGALDHYRRAVELYADQGLLTNAVAVCNKVQRLFPERHGVLARLAGLHLAMGLTADARRYVLQHDEATDGATESLSHLRSFLERCPDPAVAGRAADRLEAAGRTGEAMEVLEEVARARIREGLEVDALARKARSLDPEADVDAWSAPRLEVEEGAAEGDGREPAGAASGPEPRGDELGSLGVLETAVEETARRDAVGDADGPVAGHVREGGRDPAHLGVLQTLARLVEHRDFGAELHAERVGELAARLAGELGLGPEAVGLLHDAAPLHDIGMVVVPDRVLLKEDDLTAEERGVMRTHAANGARILSGSDLPVMRLASEIAHTHHERWDGAGYPRGLEGRGIPLSGRIVAVADAFEALTHDRPHRAAIPVDEALEEIEVHRGSHFDPRVVDALLEVQDDLAAEDRGTGGLLRAL